MAGSKGTEAVDETVISRRDAIMGALALAAGTMIAMRPEEAHAINSDPVLAAGTVYSTEGSSIQYNSTGAAGGLSKSAAWFNWHNLGGVVHAVSGSVTGATTAGSAGVEGYATTTGNYGVLAWNNAPAGVAVKVDGRAKFSRSGMATIAKSHSALTVAVASGIDTTSMILVTLQGSGGSGVWLKYARRVDATHFKVYLNKKSTKAVRFAWMIVD
jgi:hypothetical protein